jgi:hypothetical protein
VYIAFSPHWQRVSVLVLVLAVFMVFPSSLFPYLRKPPLSPNEKQWGDQGASRSAFVYPCDCSILRIASNKVDLFRVAHTIVASSVKPPAQATLLTTVLEVS